MAVIFLSSHDQEQYRHFLEQHPLASIHQSWQWGEFQAKNADRDRFWVVAQLDERKNIEASALIIRQKLPFGLCWLYAPRGPLFDPERPEKAQPLFDKIHELAKSEKAIFFRFDPPLTHAPRSWLNKLHARKAHQQYQPEATLVLDLTKTPEKLLSEMKPKGRYNIKVAQKHGVQVRFSTDRHNDLARFQELLKQTTGRDGFSGHPLHYYEDMLETLGPDHARLYLAEYQGKIIAASIMTYFNDTATYYFGASSNEHRNVMAPYLLQWQAILDAQKNKYHSFDFLGIAPENEPRHHLATVTDFKLKFGGQRVHYLPGQEIVYRPFWYALMKLMKALRQLQQHCKSRTSTENKAKKADQ